MLDCKVIFTPMTLNLKLLCDTSSESIGVMMYRQIIASLMYLTNTRPYILFDVHTLSQFLMDSIHVHLIAAKNLLRYLKGTMDYGIKYDANQNINLHGYDDSDQAGNTIDRKITLGYSFSLGFNMISYFSKRKSCMVMSTQKENYVASSSASCEQVCLGKLLPDLFDIYLDVTCIFYDNQSCMKLTENPLFHEKLKHIVIKFHYIRDMVQRGVVNLQYMERNEKISNLLTKTLAKVKFNKFIERLSVISNNNP